MEKDLFRAMYHNSYHRNNGMPWNFLSLAETSEQSRINGMYAKPRRSPRKGQAV